MNFKKTADTSFKYTIQVFEVESPPFHNLFW